MFDDAAACAHDDRRRCSSRFVQSPAIAADKMITRTVTATADIPASPPPPPHSPLFYLRTVTPHTPPAADLPAGHLSPDLALSPDIALSPDLALSSRPPSRPAPNMSLLPNHICQLHMKAISTPAGDSASQQAAGVTQQRPASVTQRYQSDREVLQHTNPSPPQRAPPVTSTTSLHHISPSPTAKQIQPLIRFYPHRQRIH